MFYVDCDQLSGVHCDEFPSFAEAAGYILGAASCCSDVERLRLLIAIDRVKEIVEASECDVAFRAGLAAGAKALGAGALDRAQACAGLAMLERMIGR